MIRGLIRHKYYLILFLIMSLILCCSPKNKYRILSTFFDGVPNPAADSLAVSDTLSNSDSLSSKTGKSKKVKPVNYIHPPYENNGCTNCHNQKVTAKLLMPQPALCYNCHEDFSKKYAFLHGPVAVGGCTKCHNPHMSKNKKLLSRKDQEICFYCHSSEQVLKNEVHAEIGKEKCTSCHNPHGGSDRFLLGQNNIKISPDKNSNNFSLGLLINKKEIK